MEKEEEAFCRENMNTEGHKVRKRFTQTASRTTSPGVNPSFFSYKEKPLNFL
jgi:hypothetical protein